MSQVYLHIEEYWFTNQVSSMMTIFIWLHDPLWSELAAKVLIELNVF